MIFLLVIFTILSCSSSQEIVRQPRDTAPVVTSKKRPADAKVDTVKWIEIAKDNYPPIEYDGSPKVVKVNSYNAALMMPFNAENYSESSSGDERFIQFYAGVKLGLKKLEEELINLNLEVFDTESSPSILNSKLSAINSETNIIIGPYDRDLLREAASFAKRQKIPLVSPWQSSSRIASENPFYIQLRPDLRDHYNKMVDEVLKAYRPDQVVILKQEDGSDDNRVKYIQDYAAMQLDAGRPPFREFSVNEDSLILSEFYLADQFDELNETVFLIQNYSFNEDDFVYNCLRKLSAAKGLRSTTVFGLPLLLDTDKIDFNLYKLLNVKVVRSRFVDIEKPEIKHFRSEFLNEFHVLPDDEAYYGFDVIVYFGRALNEFGKEFQYYLDQNSKQLLQTSFDIQKSFGDERTISDDFRDINYFVNKHLDIIEFKGNKFKVANK